MRTLINKNNNLHSIFHKGLLCLGFFTVALLSSCGQNADKKDGHNHTENEVQTEVDDHDERVFISNKQWLSNKMELTSISEKEFPITIKTSGMIDVPPHNKAVVNVPKGGYVKHSPLLIGDKVRKGQVLLTVENPEFIQIQQDYLELSQQLNYLKSEYQRYKTMYDEKVTAKKNYLKAQSEYNTAKARHNGLRKQLTLLHISPVQVANGKLTSVINVYAPISGSITKINVVKGTYVSPSTEIMEIINNEHLHLELTVFEKDVMQLKKGQKISFYIPEISKAPFDAEIHLVGNSITEERTVKVHGHIHDEDEHHFLSGMFVEADIIISTNTKAALSEKAIAEVEGEYFALQLDKKTNEGYYFNKVEIHTGATNNGFVVVKDKISKKEQFLNKDVFHLVGEGSGHSH